MKARTPGETWRCECGAQLIGARTKDGKVAPIVYNPSDDGNVLVFRGRDGTLECRTFAAGVLACLVAEGVTLRLNHFADCPNATKFGRAA